jgi:hypothetical protein
VQWKKGFLSTSSSSSTSVSSSSAAAPVSAMPRDIHPSTIASNPILATANAANTNSDSIPSVFTSSAVSQSVSKSPSNSASSTAVSSSTSSSNTTSTTTSSATLLKPNTRPLKDKVFERFP